MVIPYSRDVSGSQGHLPMRQRPFLIHQKRTALWITLRRTPRMAAKVPDDVWVVIPAYNEKRHILEVIKATKRFASNIVVVDDGSKDNTTRLALAQGVTVLQMIVNLGKGAALKTGCDFALRQGAKRIVVMDSDGQQNPARL